MCVCTTGARQKTETTPELKGARPRAETPEKSAREKTLDEKAAEEEDLEPVSVELARESLFSFSVKTTTAMDPFHLRNWALLGNNGLEVLCGLFTVTDVSGLTPGQTHRATEIFDRKSGWAWTPPSGRISGVLSRMDALQAANGGRVAPAQR